MANVKGKDNFAVTPTVNGVNVSLVGHNHDHNILTNYVANQHIDHSTLSVLAGVGMTGGGVLTANRTVSLNINGLTTDATPDGAADYVVTYDTSAGTHKRVLLNNLPGTTGGTYTERWTNLGTPTSASTWQTRVATGAAANSMVWITISITGNSSETIGVRDVGSSLTRNVLLSKGGSLSFTAKLNGSSQFQWFSSTTVTANVTFYLAGERS